MPENINPATEPNPDDLAQQIDPEAKPLVRDEYITRFLMGDITASDMIGLTRDELYMIAKRGYELMEQGKVDEARQVYEGLVLLDPYDPYFYTVLGSVYQRLDDEDKALECYNQSLRMQPWNLSALTNRGELLFKQGKLTDAFKDFQRVIELDPGDKNRSTLRAKAIVLALKETLEKQQA